MTTSLTDEEKQTNEETLQHIRSVQRLLGTIAAEISRRGEVHDESKMEAPELATFVKFTPMLKDSSYGTAQYKGLLRSMKPALEHHYANNSHHPEHFKNGVNTVRDFFEVTSSTAIGQGREETP